MTKSTLPFAKNNNLPDGSQVLILLALLLIIAVNIPFGLLVGTKDISFSDACQSFFHLKNSSDIDFIIWKLRMPRIFLALLTGMSLTLAGFVMQAIIRNPLADPYILGTSSGASLGVNLIYLGYISITSYTVFTFPLFAFIGALTALLIVVFIGYSKKSPDTNHLLLAGIAVSSFFMALISFLTYKSDNTEKLRSVIFWMLGGFDRASWELLWIPASVFLVCLIYFFVQAKRLDLMLLGEMQAQTLGMNVGKTKFIFLILISLLIGTIVSVSGPVGFIGLVVPHVARGVMGVSHRFTVLFGSLLGGLFLLWCDLLARIIYPPAGLPIGVITAMLGVPFFIYLILRKNSFK